VLMRELARELLTHNRRGTSHSSLQCSSTSELWALSNQITITIIRYLHPFTENHLCFVQNILG
jgi:hypothetical protein